MSASRQESSAAEKSVLQYRWLLEFHRYSSLSSRTAAVWLAESLPMQTISDKQLKFLSEPCLHIVVR
jgi:hypothetical protein